MVKIKDIRERLAKSPSEYLEIELMVAKRTLAVFFLLYYTAFLFTIGGFSFSFVSLTFLSSLTYHLYSILVIVMGWFIFSVIEYIHHIYFPEKAWIKYVGMVLALVFSLFGLAAHLFQSIV